MCAALNFETCQVFKKAYFLFPISPAVPCMQLACYASAFWVALTRVKDHMHHPGDVIAGALIGTLLQVSNYRVSNFIFVKSRRHTPPEKFSMSLNPDSFWTILCKPDYCKVASARVLFTHHYTWQIFLNVY